MVDNNLDKYTIIVEEQDNYTIELNGQGPQGARGPIGPQGIQGEKGDKGDQGDVGPANTLTVGSVTKGEEAEVTIEGKSPNQTINFVLPKGDKGDKGDQGIQGVQGVQGIQGEVGPQGEGATITIGKVETVDPNTSASVTNVGTSTDSILDFKIPRGYKGEAATIVVGSTTTSEPGTEANVVNSGDKNMAILEFTIPKGEKGDKGDTGDIGPQGDQGIEGPQGPQGLKGVSVTGVEQISKVGLVATYRMYFSDGTNFDYEVTDGSVEGVTREQVISLIGYEPASYTSVEGLTTRVITLEERVEDLTASRANVSLTNLDNVGEKRFTDIQTALDGKQNKGNYALKSEIPTNNNQLINGAGYITSNYHDSTKQDVIPDLETIRAGAAKGATAIQNTNDCVHLTGNETIAGTKTFSSTISGSINGKSTKLDTPRVDTDYNSLPIMNTTYIEEHQNYSHNQPEENWFFAQTMQGGDALYAGQLAMGMTSENVYYRNKAGGIWRPWKKLAFTTDNVASATKATQDGNGNNIVDTYATKTSLNTKADTSLSNITDAGKQVIKDNSGGWNPPLLSSFWADHLLNRMDMLRADTFSWQDGNTYSSAYNELLSEYNNSASTTETEGSITFKRTPKGYKIALASQETAILNKYNSDGVAWYYILDIGSAVGGKPGRDDRADTNKRFKLPRAKHPSLVNSTSTVPVYGNGMALGFTDGTNFKGSGFYAANVQWMTFTAENYGKSVSTSGSSGPNNFPSGAILGLTTDSSKSGIVADLSNNVKDYNMYLYFYVGNFTESAEAQTAGLNSELLNGKADVDTPSIQAPYLKTTYINGTSGYRIWSDGYCEQWGRVTGHNVDITLNFLKPFKDNNYNITQAEIGSGGNDAYMNSYQFISLTPTSMICRMHNDATKTCAWRASGYLAEGEF